MITASLKTNCFQDSVSLMIISKKLSALEQVAQVSVMMGTPANKDLLTNTGMWSDVFDKASPNDICIAVELDEAQASSPEQVLALVEQELDNELANLSQVSRGKSIPTVRSWSRANKIAPDTNIALISVAGEYAAQVADQALDLGKHVMLFSDNVPLEAELALKQKAAAKGLIVMGPDCGTSIIHGYPLAFANQMPKGTIGIVGASGTGIQELCSQIALNGHGLTHAIGLGGRDLSEAIGGISALTALDYLDQDQDTQVIAFVSKPPAEAVRQKIIAKMQSLSKPVVALFLGSSQVGKVLPTTPNPQAPDYANLTLANTLHGAALKACEKASQQALLRKIYGVGECQATPAYQGGKIVGLYTGGTLAAEAAILTAQALELELDKDHDKGVMLHAQGHTIIDLGDDFYTLGRPHPMIEPSTRTDQILKLQDQDFKVLLMDVVLGYGSCDNPAQAVVDGVNQLSELRKLHASKLGNPEFTVITTVTGTSLDPQNRDQQIELLEQNGILVVANVQQAVDLAVELITAPAPQAAGSDSQASLVQQQGAQLLADPRIINIGLYDFADDLAACQAKVTHFRWQPIAGGNPRMIELLKKLG